ncbi:MAG TPA: hypothetical protein VFS34_14895 [Thermoanaerobaculia bacterium]|nr:hypothetical protein [Thermoanaerobaculia bacterium]
MQLSVFAVVLAAAAPPTAPGACSLVDRDVVAAAQGTRVVSTKESRAKGPRVDRRACYYQADPLARSVSLEWTSDSAPGGARARWQETFHGEGGRERGKERGEEERPKTPPAPVPGVGDEAFWVGNPASGALYALAGSSFVRVSVGGPGTPDEKRERARKIALRAVAAIPDAERGTKEPSRPDHASPHDLR